MEATNENIIKAIAFGGELSNSTFNSLFCGDGAIGSRPVIINPFMDTAVTNSVFKEIINYRKKHTEEQPIKPILLSFFSNAEILSDIVRRRYPRSNPVEVMTIEYIRYKRYIGDVTGSD